MFSLRLRRNARPLWTLDFLRTRSLVSMESGRMSVAVQAVIYRRIGVVITWTIMEASVELATKYWINIRVRWQMMRDK